MDPDSSYQLIILVVLVFLSALFSAVETALTSFNKYRLRHLVSELHPQAVGVNKLLEDPARLLGTILVGNNIVNITASVLGAALAIQLWGPKMGVLYSSLILTVVILVFGEITPKTIAVQYAERVSFTLFPFVRFFMIILYPVVKMLTFFTDLITGVLGVKDSQQSNGITEEEIISLVAAGQEDGIIHQEEKTMIHGVFEFTDTVVRDVMVPRPDIVAVEKNISFEELIKIFQEEQFSRIPVYENSVDNILGVVHIKDLIFLALQAQKDFNVCDYLRSTLFVPETKKVNELFKTMKKEKIHMAIVLDEYGSTAGLVSLEDLIEEIMGDIQDEHDSEEPDLQQIDGETFLVNASLRIDELNEKLGLNLICEEADTVGGLIFTELGRVPLTGDSVQLDGVKLTVQQMDGHRIEKVLLDKTESSGEEE
ncbi:MAG: hemolysin [Peptococcaceae bacterium]|nr:hemolysin [Peptococcaceae bacterium]